MSELQERYEYLREQRSIARLTSNKAREQDINLEMNELLHQINTSRQRDFAVKYMQGIAAINREKLNTTNT